MGNRMGTFAALALLWMAGAAVADDVARLRKTLEEGKASDIEDVAGDLWDLGPPAFEKVRTWLKDKDAKIRGCAILALPGLDPKDNAGLIVAATKDPELRTAALRSLGGLRVVRLRTVQALTEAIATGNETQIREATHSCIRLSWPAKVKDKELKAAIAGLKGVLRAQIKKEIAEERQRKKDKLKPPKPEDPWRIRIRPAEVAIRALDGSGRLSVAGHVAGRRARMANYGQGRVHRAIDRGLQWLADHQDVDAGGRWDCDEFHKHDPADDKCDGEGGPKYDPGVTGLALLAFLGAGHLPHDGGPYSKNVKTGLAFLRLNQDEEGTFTGRSKQSYIYNHAIAAQAMAEAWILTGHPGYRASAARGMRYLRIHRNPGLAWYYELQGNKNATSVTAWCTHAVRAGDLGGIPVDPKTWAGARLWIEKMTDPEYGRIGYDMPGGMSSRARGTHDKFWPDNVFAMNGAGVFARLLAGESPKLPILRVSTRQCLEHPPQWKVDEGIVDMMYWYWASLAIHQLGGKDWRDWSKPLLKAILSGQHTKKGATFGSWDPIGPWGADGGRVYSTAMMVLTLETPFRFARRAKR